jgi:hypothetical protein
MIVALNLGSLHNTPPHARFDAILPRTKDANQKIIAVFSRANSNDKLDFSFLNNDKRLTAPAAQNRRTPVNVTAPCRYIIFRIEPSCLSFGATAIKNKSARILKMIFKKNRLEIGLITLLNEASAFNIFLCMNLMPLRFVILFC